MQPDPTRSRTAATDPHAEAAPPLQPVMRPAWTRLLDALAMTLLVIAAAHEAWIWLGGQGWLTRLPQVSGNESSRVLGVVFGCAAAYGIYMVVRSWRRVG